MNTQTTAPSKTSAWENEPTAARPLNQMVASFPSAQRHYAWGPGHDGKSGRFFTGHSWGPKNS
jgi:hypothetical protein